MTVIMFFACCWRQKTSSFPARDMSASDYANRKGRRANFFTPVLGFLAMRRTCAALFPLFFFRFASLSLSSGASIVTTYQQDSLCVTREDILCGACTPFKNIYYSAISSFTPSRCSIIFFIFRPPPKPPSVPSARMTR